MVSLNETMPASVEDGEAKPSPNDARPSRRRQVFGSIFTPTWSLSLLILLCMFLPSYEGCNGNTIYPYQAFGELEATATGLCRTFWYVWPYFFAVVVAVGTVRLAAGRDPRKSAMLWWGLSLLIVVNAVLLVAALSFPDDTDAGPWELVWQVWWIVVPSLAMLIWVPLSRRCCRDLYGAAQSLQLGLALLSALAFTTLIPALMLASDYLIGGVLAVAASVLLFICTVIQWYDGRRALTRRRDESALRLSLSMTLLLMLLGGIACSWIGVVYVYDGEREQQKANARLSASVDATPFTFATTRRTRDGALVATQVGRGMCRHFAHYPDGRSVIGRKRAVSGCRENPRASSVELRSLLLRTRRHGAQPGSPAPAEFAG